MAGFRTLRQRIAGPQDPDEVLPLDVLPYMRQPLFAWLAAASEGNYYGDPDKWQILCQMLKIDYTGTTPAKAALDAVNADNNMLLDLIDARLRLGGAGVLRHLSELKTTLLLAGSGWQVNDQGDALEQVVDEAVREAAKAAIRAANESAGTHLANSWALTFGREKNPSMAHAEMIRAVESAAAPVITPKDRKATLGTLIGQLESNSALYTTSGASPENDGVAGVVAMMRTLWQQQTDRHGAHPTIPANQSRVEFLLPIAVALVHIFANGHVQRR